MLSAASRAGQYVHHLAKAGARQTGGLALLPAQTPAVSYFAARGGMTEAETTGAALRLRGSQSLAPSGQRSYRTDANYGVLVSDAVADDTLDPNLGIEGRAARLLTLARTTSLAAQAHSERDQLNDFLQPIVNPQALCHPLSEEQMSSGLTASREQVLAGYGPGVDAAFEQCALQRGDRVGQHHARHLTLGVWLARHGIQYAGAQSVKEIHKSSSAVWRRWDEAGDDPAAQARRQAHGRIALSSGSGFPSGEGFKMLLSLSAFQYMSLDAVKRSLLEAAQKLKSDGALVVEFEHAAGSQRTGASRTLVSLREIESVLQFARLDIAQLHLDYALHGAPEKVLLTQRVEAGYRRRHVTPKEADDCAMRGWRHEAVRDAVADGAPDGGGLMVRASGFFFKN